LIETISNLVWPESIIPVRCVVKVTRYKKLKHLIITNQKTGNIDSPQLKLSPTDTLQAPHLLQEWTGEGDGTQDIFENPQLFHHCLAIA
jgi:hypothetical protein